MLEEINQILGKSEYDVINVEQLFKMLNVF